MKTYISMQRNSDGKICNYLKGIEFYTKLTGETLFFYNPPTLQECFEAVLEMKNNYSP